MKEKAYAKINLFLNVIGKRDDGYHDLEMVMASIDLFDVLSFEKTNNGIIDIISETPITNTKEENIVYKVAKYVQETFGVEYGVNITIKKNIPIAAGLAGGSADAAATLRGLNKLWKLKLTLNDLAKIGETFGSDIPFCIYNKLCIARGKGEELFFIDNKLNFSILLVNPNIKVSTKEVFDNITEEMLVNKKSSDMANAIYNKNFDLVARELFNSLEPITFKMVPDVQKIKKLMTDWELSGALMCGSGATVFGISKDKDKIKNVYEIMNDQYFKIITKIR